MDQQELILERLISGNCLHNIAPIVVTLGNLKGCAIPYSPWDPDIRREFPSLNFAENQVPLVIGVLPYDEPENSFVITATLTLEAVLQKGTGKIVMLRRLQVLAFGPEPRVFPSVAKFMLPFVPEHRYEELRVLWQVTV